MNNKHLFYISFQSIRILDLKIDFQREIIKEKKIVTNKNAYAHILIWIIV